MFLVWVDDSREASAGVLGVESGRGDVADADGDLEAAGAGGSSLDDSHGSSGGSQGSLQGV